MVRPAMNKFIIGLILGIAIAGSLAYYLNNVPTQFVNKVTNSPAAIMTNAVRPVILAPGTKYQIAPSDATAKSDTSANTNAKNASAPTYDFYDVLQGKKSASNNSNNVPTKVLHYYLQVGIFDSQDLANDMKAQLALLGVDAIIKSQQHNGKIINQIIIGPFNSESAATDTTKILKDNDITATLIQIDN